MSTGMAHELKARLTFPLVIDSTLLNAWRQCPTQAKWSGFRKIKPLGINIDLHAGAAFARGLEVTRRRFYNDHKDPDTAIATGIAALVHAYGDPAIFKDTPKTWDRMAGALEAYFGQYPLGEDSIVPACYNNKWAIEFSFAVPLDMWGFRHPETNDPILLAGRTDMIGTFRNSDFVVDEKTTTQLGESWSRKWDMRAQFMCYMWAAREFGFNIAGTIVRGVAIRKTGYDFAEALLRRDDRMIDIWQAQTQRTIREMLIAYEDYTKHERSGFGQPLSDPAFFSYNLGEACESYGGCAFKQLCLSADPEPHIRTDYEHNPWNPLVKIEPQQEPQRATS